MLVASFDIYLQNVGVLVYFTHLNLIMCLIKLDQCILALIQPPLGIKPVKSSCFYR